MVGSDPKIFSMVILSFLDRLPVQGHTVRAIQLDVHRVRADFDPGEAEAGLAEEGRIGARKGSEGSGPAARYAQKGLGVA